MERGLIFGPPVPIDYDGFMEEIESEKREKRKKIWSESPESEKMYIKMLSENEIKKAEDVLTKASDLRNYEEIIKKYLL